MLSNALCCILFSVFFRCAVTVVFWGRRTRTGACLVITACPWASSVASFPGPAAWMEPQITRRNPQYKLSVGEKYLLLIFSYFGRRKNKQNTTRENLGNTIYTFSKYWMTNLTDKKNSQRTIRVVKPKPTLPPAGCMWPSPVAFTGERGDKLLPLTPTVDTSSSSSATPQQLGNQ